MLKLTHLKSILCTGVAVASLSPALALAGTPVPEREPLTEEIKKSAISGDLGVAFCSQYILRGLIYENQGVIAQPYLNLYFKVYEGEGFINEVKVILGIWSSLHSRHTDAHPDSTVPAWFEFDYTPGIAVTFAKNFTLTSSLYAYTSPNGGFDNFYGANFQLNYDDSDLLGAFALNPHITYLRELEGKAGSGKSEGNYYEFGIAPALPACGPLTVTIPLTVGFGSHNFYAENTGFGYFSGGVNAALALGFIPEQFGTWTLTGSATYYYLNGSLADFNNPNVRPSRHNEFVFCGGLGVAF
jgi:hypothetical protein